jgi:hypothetical protein
LKLKPFDLVLDFLETRFKLNKRFFVLPNQAQEFRQISHFLMNPVPRVDGSLENFEVGNDFLGFGGLVPKPGLGYFLIQGFDLPLFLSEVKDTP